MKFKSNIKKIMRERKVKAKELESLAGLSDRSISKLRTDEGFADCRFSTLARVAEALGVSVKDLFDEVEEPKEKAPRKESL